MLQITRRDFVNSTLVGAGASLLAARAPGATGDWSVSSRPAPPIAALGDDWYGNGGVGDYATSHGNTPELVAQAHEIRHRRLAQDSQTIDTKDTGEHYDTIIVGAGLAGLGAAYEFVTNAPHSARCLILDNHPVFGGEAKENQFEVDGYLLTAPQGSNGFSIPPAGAEDELAYASGDAYYYDRLGVPREFEYSPATGGAEKIRCGNDNYGFLHWLHDRIDVSHFFRHQGVAQHAKNIWSQDLESLQAPERVRRAFLEWNSTRVRPHPDEGLAQWLDSMSSKHYLEQILGLDPAVTAYLDNILGSAAGAGCDATSAYVMYAVGLPGFGGYHDPYLDHRHSFPGGNSAFARYFMKKIKPEAIAGGSSFADIVNGRIQFAQLDQAGDPVRMRLSSTVTDAHHLGGDPGNAESVLVSYIKDGQSYRVSAKSLILATGAWVNKHVVRELPIGRFAALDSLNHTAFLVANVALRNWRFLEKLGVSGCLYQGEFGFSCNLRNPMVVGDQRQPHDPGKPAVLSFYLPFISPGLAPAEQGFLGRMQLFSTSFAEYERQIIAQMNVLFAASGFKAERDLAGIILNRWGHAYLMLEPGTFFGRDGKPSVLNQLRQPFGRIAFGHSEMQGMQHWGPAAMEGRRAFHDVKRFI